MQQVRTQHRPGQGPGGSSGTSPRRRPATTCRRSASWSPTSTGSCASSATRRCWCRSRSSSARSTPTSCSEAIRRLLRAYRSTLPGDRRVLLESYDYVQLARKVVGVGSVGHPLLGGRSCWAATAGDPLLLQVKEAPPSVLEEFVGRSRFDQLRPAGRRGAAADAGRERHLPGLAAHHAGMDGVARDFYVRQLRDWKGSVEVEAMRPAGLAVYAAAAAAGRWPGRTPAPATGSRSRRTWARSRRVRPRGRPVRVGLRRPERARPRGAAGRHRVRAGPGRHGRVSSASSAARLRRAALLPACAPRGGAEQRRGSGQVAQDGGPPGAEQVVRARARTRAGRRRRSRRSRPGRGPAPRGRRRTARRRRGRRRRAGASRSAGPAGPPRATVAGVDPAVERAAARPARRWPPRPHPGLRSRCRPRRGTTRPAVRRRGARPRRRARRRGRAPRRGGGGRGSPRLGSAYARSSCSTSASTPPAPHPRAAAARGHAGPAAVVAAVPAPSRRSGRSRLGDLAGDDVVGVDDPVRVALLGEEPLPVRGEVLVDGVAGDDGVEARGVPVCLGPQDPARAAGPPPAATRTSRRPGSRPTPPAGRWRSWRPCSRRASSPRRRGTPRTAARARAPWSRP